MARTKQKRLSKLSELENVFSIRNPDIQEQLIKYFKYKKQFTLEIGCGHGDYSVELAQKFPKRNFIGIDVKGARIFKGATKAVELNMNNVAFIITKAEWLEQVFNPETIEEIYIPFPEPHFKVSNQSRRLISLSLLNIYKKLLIRDGLIQFKTDNQDSFEYALKSISDAGGKILQTTENLHNDVELRLSPGITTTFEKHYINGGRKIKYICFGF